ncbi:hypothetical protein GN156_02940 [bacterium LRH843]|nr:hypothetical protein [bacterium LRH843]
MDELQLNYLKEKYFVNSLELDINGMTSNQLKDQAIMEQLVSRRTSVFEATDLRVGGANMMKWFGNLFMAHVYIYVKHHQFLTYDDVCFVESGKKAEFQLINVSAVDVDQVNRSILFQTHVQTFFTTFRPVFECIAKTSTLPIQQVWGLLCNPFYKGYEAWIEESNCTIKAELREDLERLKMIDPDFFGLKRNPFDVSFRYVENWKNPDENVRVKAACCMSYLKGRGNYCYACPKMTREQRSERAEQLRENQKKKQA